MTKPTELVDDIKAAQRILLIPVADLLDGLISKGVLTIDEACGTLEASSNSEAIGPHSTSAREVLFELSVNLREIQRFRELRDKS